MNRINQRFSLQLGKRYHKNGRQWHYANSLFENAKRLIPKNVSDFYVTIKMYLINSKNTFTIRLLFKKCLLFKTP
jgi:hypothetical protein